MYFAPELGSYKTLSAKPIEVNIEESEDSGNLVVVGGSRSEQRGVLEVLGNDIAPIIPAHQGLNRPGPRLAVDSTLGSLPPLAYAACLMLLRHRRRLEEDTGYARTRRARSRGMKRLRRVAKSDDPAEELYRALAGFLGDKLNVEDAGMTSQDASAALREYRFSDGVHDPYVKILRECERHRYAGGTLSPQEIQALTEAGAKAMDDFEAELAERKK